MPLDLVTGGRGFIGRHVQGKSYDIENGKDILNFAYLALEAMECERVIHLAAISGVLDCEKDPYKADNVNVLGTFNVCRLGIPVVFASTAGAINGDSVYAKTKREAEEIILEKGGCVLRFANVYGPGMEGKNSLIARGLRDKNITIRGDGEQTRDFVHVYDVVKAIEMAQPGLWTVATGQTHSVNEVVELMGLNPTYEPANPSELTRSEIDCKPLPGWEPTYTLEEGLKCC